MIDRAADWTGAACYAGMRSDGSLRIDPRTFDANPPTGRERRHAKARTYCERCPLRSPCFVYGADHKLAGTYGGVYIENGRPIKPPRPGRTPAEDKEQEPVPT